MSRGRPAGSKNKPKKAKPAAFAGDVEKFMDPDTIPEPDPNLPDCPTEYNPLYGPRMPELPLLVHCLKTGMTAAEIAKNCRVSVESVYSLLNRNRISLKLIQAWRENRADVLALRQISLVEAMTPEKIADTSIRDLATSFNILHTAERLEQGKSTANVSLASLNSSLEELEEAEKRIVEQLETMKGGATNALRNEEGNEKGREEEVVS